MCEFCVKHGDGEKWYFNMENYSLELQGEQEKIDYMLDFANHFEARVPAKLDWLERLKHSPFHPVARPFLTRSQKINHFGQVVPIEEVEKILSRLDNIARLPCPCRRVTTGERNARYCFALTAHPRLAAELDDSYNLEYMSSEEAIAAVREMDNDGLIHSVWTFKTPFIGALCNCDKDCVAYRICHSSDYFKIMFRAEWVAEVNLDNCNGCRNCMRHCYFGAIRYSAVQNKVEVDPTHCYGCGLCRAACHKDAIQLAPRAEVEAASTIW
jgi:ferredoxin